MTMQTSKEANHLVVRRWFSVSRERLFRALTDPAVMERWFFAGEGWTAKVDNDLTVGGRYQIDMHDNDGNVYSHTGEYRQIEAPEKLVFTWNSASATDTVVTIELRPVRDGTEVTLIHDFLPDDESRRNHEAGWQGCFENLQYFLAKKGA